MKYLLLFFSFLNSYQLLAQFAPQAGLLGSTAIIANSNIITAWADSCMVTHSWKNALDTTLGKTTVGNNASALLVDNNVVSLGDGGEAIYYLKNAIVNGIGADFAIFENGFYNATDSNLAFLELAFVEVSEDGNNYYRFNATSNTDTTIQILGFGGNLDARNINNLAGKYVAGYGTPFDLQELSNTSLNINNIHFVKVIDVVGALNTTICSYDINANKINDPFPTPFASGGFDLDALGIIHQANVTSNQEIKNKKAIKLYPNPANNYVIIEFENAQDREIKISNSTGQTVYSNLIKDKINTVQLGEKIATGIYYIQIVENGLRTSFKLLKE